MKRMVSIPDTVFQKGTLVLLIVLGYYNRNRRRSSRASPRVQ